MTKDEIEIIATKLYQQALDANSAFIMIQQYYRILNEYHDVVECAPAFYTVTLQALQKACFVDVAKMFDVSDKAVSIGYLLKICKENIKYFPQNKEESYPDGEGNTLTFSVPYNHRLRKQEECFFKEYVENERRLMAVFKIPDSEKIPVTKDFTFNDLLGLYQKRFHSLGKKLEGIRQHRNKFYVHNDMNSVLELSDNHKLPEILYSDVKELIEYALDVTRMIIGILTDISKPETYSNIDDIEVLMMLARSGVEEMKKRDEEIMKSMRGI